MPALRSPARPRWGPLLAYPIVIGAGFSILLLEITAGRLLAPVIGVSLETWTGIIGIVLAGYALGDALGGYLVDRIPSPRLLAATLCLGGIGVMATVPVTDMMRGVWLGAPLLARVVLIAAIVLLAPAALLGTVLPIVTRLTLRTTAAAGGTAGGLSAAATASSVVGVALGGFYLLEHFGIRVIVLAAGAGLVALAVIALAASADGRPRDAGAVDATPSSGIITARPPAPLLLAALGGAAVMVVELAGARLAAPLFGSSLYTWASVIGVTLLGISLGNALGGRLADRQPRPRLLAHAFALSGTGTLAVLLMPYVYSRLWPRMTDAVLAALPPALSLPLLLGAMLLPAAVGFGTVSPILIRLSIRSIGTSGDVVGRIYAAQAVGSIAGTFAAGFLLISLLGARAVVLLVAQSAVLVGVLIAGSGTPAGGEVRPLIKVAAGAAFVFTVVVSAAGWVPSPCLRESNYYCIRVLDVAPGTRALALDSLIHSYVDLKDPTALRYDYEKGWAVLAADVAARRSGSGNAPPLRALFVGGGGYVFPRYLYRLYPASWIEVVEIDPAVTRVAVEALGLSPGLPLRTWNEDGRQFFLRRPQHTYDFVFTDVFRDAYSIPYHLTTREFARLVADALAPGGVYAVNIVDGRVGLFARSYVRTLQQVFRHVYLLPAGADWRRNVQTIFVVFAAQQPLDLRAITARRPPGVTGEIPLVPLTEEELAGYLAAGPSVVLTDDHAPVENFLARVYAEAVRER